MSNSIFYVHPDAREALNAAFKAANMTPVLVQTQGNATASAGTHNAAGKYKQADGTWHDYSACIDISINQNATRHSDGASIKMTPARIKWLLFCLSEQGIVAWYRVPSQGFTPHIHCVCSMVKMPEICARQVVDFLSDKTGLKSHGKEKFWVADDDADAHIAKLFMAANPDFKRLVPQRLKGKI